MIENEDKLSEINRITIITDRFYLSDSERTNHFKIEAWRRNKWCNHEGKPIKNNDLLDKVDKERKKIMDKFHCSLSIEYQRRKFNRVADKLAKVGKSQPQVLNKIKIHGLKIGRRKFSDEEIEYRLLNRDDRLHIHIFKKEPLKDLWEIGAEICSGMFVGKKLKILVDSDLENILHRQHEYEVIVKETFNYHISIKSKINEIAL